MVKVKSEITMDDFRYFENSYNPLLEPNKFFDEIYKIDHRIEVPSEYREVLEGHVCTCGKLIISSFFPKELMKEYDEYTKQKEINELMEKKEKDLANEIKQEILKDIEKK